MVKKLLCATFLAVAGMFAATNVMAQDGDQPLRTWKGADYTKLDNNHRVLLYNVGTGRFLINAGDWGVQGRLFHNDSGKLLYFQNNNGRYYFDTGMTTDQGVGAQKYFAINVPGVSHKSAANYTNANIQTYYTIFDHSPNSEYGAENTEIYWNFQRVPDEEGDTYTYYMYQTFQVQAPNVKYWLGAIAGDCWYNYDGYGYGYLVNQSKNYDKATWSTLQACDYYTPRTGNNYVQNFNYNVTPREYRSNMITIMGAEQPVSIEDLYKWRIVTIEEIEAILAGQDVGAGLAPNISYLITDPGFERNDQIFFNTKADEATDGRIGWIEGWFNDADLYNKYGSGRDCYTWGYYKGDPNSGKKDEHRANYANNRRAGNENWNRPLRLKAQWDQKEDAQYGFLEFEGIGACYTYIEAPEAGTYKLRAYAFCQGPHAGYMFAMTTEPNNISRAQLSSLLQEGNYNTIQQISGLEKNTSGNVMNAGKIFTNEDEKKPYLCEVEVTVENAGDKIYFGVAKLEGTRVSSQDNYYYDSDWIGADQFSLTYLGTAPALFLDEDYYNAWRNVKPGIDYKNRVVRLHRTFTKTDGEYNWNSFVFPFDLTDIQVRNAFGQASRLAEIEGLGTRPNEDKHIINFKTIPMGVTGSTVIKAGQLYLIKPSSEPNTGLPSTEGKPYWIMGTHNFSVTSLENQSVVRKDYEGDADYLGIFTNGTFANGGTAPAGSYVISNNKLYHIQSPTVSRGYRGWIENVQGDEVNGLNGMSIYSANDVVDAIIGIDEDATINSAQGVYDISGRRVSESYDNLPRGMYIVNGKKVIVK